MRAHWKHPRRRLLLVPAALLLLLLLAALAANPLARWQTRRILGRVPGVDTHVEAVTVGFFPPTYRVHGLAVALRDRRSAEPLLRAENVSVRLLLTPLLAGRLVVDVTARRPRLVLEQPAPRSGQPHLPEPSDLGVAVVLRSLDVEEGEVRYVWVRKMNVPAITFHRIEATLRNVPSRPGLTEGPMELEARGMVGKTGTMTVNAQAPSFETPLSFEGKATVSGFDVSEMNELISAQKGVTLEPGKFALSMSFHSREGKLTGRVSPHLEGSGIASSGGGPLDGLKAALGRIKMSYAGATGGTAKSGTITISDDVSQPGRQLLVTLEKVIENGFLLGMEEGLKRATGGGAEAGEAGEDRTPTRLNTGR